MSNLEMIEKSFGIIFDRGRSDFGLGPVPSEADVLVRRLLKTGGLERVRYPFSLRESLEPRPTCCLDVALLLAIEEDNTHLARVCEIGERLDRIRLRKGQELVSIRDARHAELRQDNLGGDLGEAVNDRYRRAADLLSAALRKEESTLVSCWTRWGWVETAREAEVASAWEQYFRAENLLKESLNSKVLRLGWKSRV